MPANLEEARAMREPRLRRHVLLNVLVGLLSTLTVLVLGWGLTVRALGPAWLNYLVAAPFFVVPWDIVRERWGLREPSIIDEAMWDWMDARERRRADLLLVPCVLLQWVSVGGMLVVIAGLVPAWVALVASAGFVLAQAVDRGYGWWLRHRYGRPLIGRAPEWPPEAETAPEEARS